MYETILVGTDGSANANRAVVQALDQAEEFGAELHGIFVVTTDRHDDPTLGTDAQPQAEVETQGQEFLDDISRRAADLDMEFDGKIAEGRPHEEIVRYADAIDADMIVLGYQGHSHSDPATIGSTTDRVVRTAGRPTLVV